MYEVYRLSPDGRVIVAETQSSLIEAMHERDRLNKLYPHLRYRVRQEEEPTVYRGEDLRRAN